MSHRYEPDDDVDQEVRDRRANLAQIAAETIAVAKAGEYVAPSGARVAFSPLVDACVSETRVIVDHAELVERARDSAKDREPVIEVTREKSGECARRLLREGARPHPSRVVDDRLTIS